MVHAIELTVRAVELMVHAIELTVHTIELMVHAIELTVHAIELTVHAIETAVRGAPRHNHRKQTARTVKHTPFSVAHPLRLWYSWAGIAGATGRLGTPYRVA